MHLVRSTPRGQVLYVLRLHALDLTADSAACARRGPGPEQLWLVRSPTTGAATAEISAASSCVDTSGDTVKLGFLNSLTGGMAISEKTVSNVLHMAADEINADGGILGKKIEYVQEDGATDWPTFAEKTEKLLTQDCVAAIFGGWTSSSRKAVKPVVEKNNGLLLLPGAVRGPRGVAEHLLHRRDHQPADHPGDGLPRRQGREEAVPRGQRLRLPAHRERDHQALRAELGIEIVGEEYVPLDKDDWTTQVAKIVAAKPDFVFNTINGSSNVGFVKAYYDAGLKRGDHADHLGVDRRGGGAGHGPRVTGHYASWNYFQSLETATNPKFIESWKAYPDSSGVTSDPMEAAYISLYLYKALVEAAGSFDVDKVNAAARRRHHVRRTGGHRHAQRREPPHLEAGPHRPDQRRQPVRHRLVAPTSPSSPTRSSRATTGSRRRPRPAREIRGLIAPPARRGLSRRLRQATPDLPPPHREREHAWTHLVPPLLNGTARVRCSCSPRSASRSPSARWA